MAYVVSALLNGRDTRSLHSRQEPPQCLPYAYAYAYIVCVHPINCTFDTAYDNFESLVTESVENHAHMIQKMCVV